MAAKGIMETFYVSFLGPIVYNSVAMSLRATGEELIEEITARQMMEGRKLKIVEYTVEPDKTLELFRVKTRYCGRYRVLRMRTSRTSISRSVTIRYCGR